MKKLVLISAVIGAIFNGCERCYECSGEIPVFVNGIEAGTVESTQDFCESSLNARAEVEAYESEGYVCVQK